MASDEGVVYVLDEKAFIAVEKVPKEAGFGGALLHADVLQDGRSIVIETSCSLLSTIGCFS